MCFSVRANQLGLALSEKEQTALDAHSGIFRISSDWTRAAFSGRIAGKEASVDCYWHVYNRGIELHANVF